MQEPACTPRSVRHGLIELLSTRPYTHGLTLNTDRELSLTRLRMIFGTFCHDLDRVILGTPNVRRCPRELRFNAIAFPEHLDTNAHLHVHADLRALSCNRTVPQVRNIIHRVWRTATRGAGSVDVQELQGDGFAWYSTKDARGTDPIYFLSHDFHPR